MEHKKLAIELFNRTWDLLDLQHRSQEQNADMITMAHASLYHWSQVKTAENIVIGLWQISRVYATVSLGDSSLFFAKQALQFCTDQGITGFNLAYVYEALARSYSICTHYQQAIRYRDLAVKESENIAEADLRKLVLDDLASIRFE